MISNYRNKSLIEKDERISVYATKVIENEEKELVRVSEIVEAIECDEDLIKLVKKLKREKRRFRRLVRKFNELSDVQFFDLYKDYYKWDVSSILKHYNKGQFKKPIFKEIKTEDVIFKNGGWFNTTYRVIVDEDFDLEDKVYSLEEINKLINDGKILVEQRKLNSYGVRLNEELCKNILLNWDKNLDKGVDLHDGFYTYYRWISEEMVESMNKQNHRAIFIIRRTLKQERVKQDYLKYRDQYQWVVEQLKEKVRKIEKERENNAEGISISVKEIKEAISRL